jgi:hypothetical protein
MRLARAMRVPHKAQASHPVINANLSFSMTMIHWSYIICLSGVEIILKTIIPSRKATSRLEAVVKKSNKSEEQTLLDSYNGDEWKSVPNQKRTIN